ncbi:SDR family oxidoreductase [Spirillospora sp. NPDC047279]|uniref:SDR family NAD(P)-dependent oxidoreductase n=1 Tax=Spirillospora sp. NPDC047279 TaxID=3155478 RepID=UPI0033E719AC
MLLEGKNAVIYGGGGSIGGAAARAFAAEGARVFLAGRTAATLERVAGDIRAAGGEAETAEVDALDERAVDEHADAVAAKAGSLDVSFNVIQHGDVQGTPFAEMSLADYERPVITALRTTFLTVRAAVRHMKRQGSGVILAFGGSGDPVRDYHVGGLQTAFEVIEAMRRQVSAELGRDGVRFVTLRTGGVPETIPAGFEGRDALIESLTEPTMLGRTATLEDVGQVAAFVASDRARTMTAATVNVSCGALIDY